MTELNFTPDFFILSIIDKEFKALMDVFSLSERTHYEGRDYYHGEISTDNGTRSIVATQSMDIGNTTSSSTTSAVLQHFKPKFFLLVGIAGGIEGTKDLALGDVVVSTNVKYYELEKESGGKVTEIFTTLANPSRILLNISKGLSETEWWKELGKNPEDGDTQPKQIPGLILSGERLLGDPVSEFLKQLLEKVPKALAVEMEGAGVATAIYDNSVHNKAEFLAIRGISDFCNKDGNQKTRDTWREYSSNSAALFARKLIENVLIDSEPSNPKGKYILKFDNNLPQKSSKKFNLEIQTNAGKVDTDSFFEAVSSNRKVLLKGYAGGGKSELVMRLSTHLIAAGITPVVITLNDFSALSEEFKNGDTIDAKMKTLLKASPVSPSIELIESFNQPYKIIIDGLNEISGGTYGDEMPRMIVGTIEDFLLEHQDAGVLITDRLTKRIFFSAWNEMTLLSMDKESVSAIIDEKFGESVFDSLSEKNQEILKTPYYLDYALKMDSPTLTSEVKVHEEFFLNILALSKEELDMLAGIIFDASNKNHGFSFSKDDLDGIGEQNFQKLEESGILKKTSDGFIFDHQLKHEYLLSRYLSQHPEKWNGKPFDVVSLESNSLESIFMTIEQLTSSEQADQFLLKVYDWNLNASIQCLIVDSELTAKKFSDGITNCMLVLVGNKQLDSVYGTSNSAKESLLKFDNTTAQQLSNVKDLKGIINLIQGFSSQHEWFEEWKSLFCRDRDLEIDEDEIHLIESDTSLVGWAATGVFRECSLSNENLLELRTIYYASDTNEPLHNTRRWRIVHVLGKFPSKKNVRLLLGALKWDDYHWVMYGAARSLIEMAAMADDELRKYILNKLTELLEGMKQNVVDEIGKTVFYKDARGAWKEDVVPILEKAKNLQTSGPYTEKWEKIKREFEEERWKN